MEELRAYIKEKESEALSNSSKEEGK